jgi:hypothetical protein
MWQAQPLATLKASVACTGITLPKSVKLALKYISAVIRIGVELNI